MTITLNSNNDNHDNISGGRPRGGGAGAPGRQSGNLATVADRRGQIGPSNRASENPRWGASS